jgi:two-component system cell cycle sensor histidine kinase PleC
MAVALLGVDAHQRQSVRLQDLKHSFEAKAAALNSLVQWAGHHIDILREVGQNGLLNHHDHVQPSYLYESLAPSANFNGYALDNLRLDEYFSRYGNLTGEMTLDRDDPELRREIEMAFRLNSLFASFHDSVPFVERIHYRSFRGFENTYPWVSSGTRHYSRADNSQLEMLAGQPVANPGRTRYWVQPENALTREESRIMTLAAPIDHHGRYLGVVAMDLDLDQISADLEGDLASVGQIFLLNNENRVLAAAGPPAPAGTVMAETRNELPAVPAKIGRFLRSGVSPSDLLILQRNMTDVPWRLVMAVPHGRILSDTIKGMWGELGALLLLVYLLMSVEHRRRISFALQKSETDLRSYVADLEKSKLQVDTLVAEMVHETTRQRDRERQLSQAQKIARLGDWHWDVKTEVVECSAELSHMLGFEEDSVAIGFDELLALVHPQDRELFISTFKETFEEKSACDFTFRVLQDDGGERFVWLDGSCELDERGEVVALFGVCQDVSVQKNTELALIQALSEAKEANQAKSDFLASMSHELRTPLNAIIGFGQVIAGQMFGRIEITRYSEYASDILASGEHLLDIIDDLLDLSKIEAGEFELHEENLDLVELAREVIKLMGPQSEKAGITLSLQTSEKEVWIRVDRRTLRQVMMNLLSNAIKFSSAGDVAVLAIEDNVAEGILLTVRDTGIGISEDDLWRVMQPFGQVASPMTRNHQGTGLGLPIVKALVKLHGGRFEMESVLGLGTTVKALFPVERRIDHLLERVS